ncbi:hypothetical protein ACPV5U_05825 [Vibrio mediterranei]
MTSAIKNQTGKWIHHAFTATSMAFYFAIVGDAALIQDSLALKVASIGFTLSIIFNGIWAFSYFESEARSNLIHRLLQMSIFAKLSHWIAIFSFIISAACIIIYVLQTGHVLVQPYCFQ